MTVIKIQWCDGLLGLHEVGIFRLPGKASRIQALKELYDAGSQQDFGNSEDVHTVASLLKLYLRELPEPVVPYVFYESYQQALEGAWLGELWHDWYGVYYIILSTCRL